MSDSLKIWHPFTQPALDPLPICIEHAAGVYLHTSDGRRLLDGISSWWVNIHGHCHPAVVAAIAEQAARLDHVLLKSNGPTTEAAGVSPCTVRKLPFPPGQHLRRARLHRPGW